MLYLYVHIIIDYYWYLLLVDTICGQKYYICIFFYFVDVYWESNNLSNYSE